MPRYTKSRTGRPKVPDSQANTKGKDVDSIRAIFEYAVSKALQDLMDKKFDTPLWLMAESAHEQLRLMDQKTNALDEVRWSMCSLLLVFGHPDCATNHIKPYFEDLSTAVGETDDPAVLDQAMDLAILFRVHEVLTDYQYGEANDIPEPYPDVESLFEPFPDDFEFDHDLFDSKKKTWKEFTLQMLEKVRVKSRSKRKPPPYVQYLEAHPRLAVVQQLIDLFQPKVAQFPTSYLQQVLPSKSTGTGTAVPKQIDEDDDEEESEQVSEASEEEEEPETVASRRRSKRKQAATPKDAPKKAKKKQVATKSKAAPSKKSKVKAAPSKKSKAKAQASESSDAAESASDSDMDMLEDDLDAQIQAAATSSRHLKRSEMVETAKRLTGKSASLKSKGVDPIDELRSERSRRAAASFRDSSEGVDSEAETPPRRRRGTRASKSRGQRVAWSSESSPLKDPPPAIPASPNNSFSEGSIAFMRAQRPCKQNGNRQRRKWTEKEVALLKKGMMEFGKGNWAIISQAYRDGFNQRTAVDLKDKFRNLVKSDNINPDDFPDMTVIMQASSEVEEDEADQDQGEEGALQTQQDQGGATAGAKKANEAETSQREEGEEEDDEEDDDDVEQDPEAEAAAVERRSPTPSTMTRALKLAQTRASAKKGKGKGTSKAKTNNAKDKSKPNGNGKMKAKGKQSAASQDEGKDEEGAPIPDQADASQDGEPNTMEDSMVPLGLVVYFCA
eukprot:m.62493 g.62493  ORF g.62493 m.62493 type:complete len:728 (+) comp11916_c0_seq3:152-2335(+)